ncbi:MULTISPECIES: TM2 domain-containing protein [unclassified Nocardioides]|uniref:TM2 domain-containing protein n=1 Tax=unclassified Nocardioides TaxID=2615069 RepID=UPI0007012BD5|nr:MULTISPECIES: TM2 domain-containing protein [unclassified Nocardioides]KQY64315.1 hypothetical protein ASD30_05070 [Nocardioides sp. Root140]KQZ70234.1 hypothetical protein ASD66_11345 [Nocardioides sp. Root151]KRF16331.1 hypothetical protein ASH02_07095 [Nocardioides sp. Soil796]
MSDTGDQPEGTDPNRGAQGEQPQQPGWGQPAPPPYGQAPQGQPPYGQAPYGQPAYGQPAYYGADPSAPYGRDPRTGEPYGDKSKVIAGVLQILIPLGIGRFYTGHTGMALAQLFTLGGCGIWSLIDGILLLVNDQQRDADGRLLKP